MRGAMLGTGVLVALMALTGCSSSHDAGTTPSCDAQCHSDMVAAMGTQPSTTSPPGTPIGEVTKPKPTATQAKRSVSSAPADRHTSGSALALLSTLAVKGRAPQTGYSRDQFGPAWTDNTSDPLGHNGCRTRDDILRRDLTQVKTADGCKVLSGVLVDPYTGKTIHFTYGRGTSNAVQIDHVVALDDAWQTGAQQWTAAKRTALANDPLNLLAVDGPTNEAKGAGDAATWLPPNKAYRCAYVARQVAVKARYGLWVTGAEHDAISRVLAKCPGQQAPIEGGHPPAVTPVRSSSPPPAVKTSPRPSKPTPTKSTTGPKVVEFANCTAMHKVYPHGIGRPGAHDHTSGTPDTQFFVSAALYDANTKSDRDKDGIACEA